MLSENFFVGEGTPGVEVVGSIPIKNEGASALYIQGVETSCACALVSLDAVTIEPGQSGHAKVSVRIKREEPETKATILIRSNDPTSPQKICLLRASRASPPLKTSPEVCDFGEVAINTSPSLTLLISKPDGSPWPSQDTVCAETVQGVVRVENVPKPFLRPGQRYALSVKLAPHLPRGPFEDTIRLRPSKTLGLSVQIEVRGRIVEPVIASPTIICFSSCADDKRANERHLLVRRTDGKDLRAIVKITAPPGFRANELPATAFQNPKTRRLLVSRDSSEMSPCSGKQHLLIWIVGEKLPVAVQLVAPAPALKRNGRRVENPTQKQELPPSHDKRG